MHLGSTDGVPVEVHEELRGAMEKLQKRFTGLMQEKADLRERIEELEHRCIQLSGETDTIGEETRDVVFESDNVITLLSFFLIMSVTLFLGEYIALYQNQRAIMKQRHVEKEEYISRLARDKEEMKVCFCQAVYTQFKFMMHVIQIKSKYKEQTLTK